MFQQDWVWRPSRLSYSPLLFLCPAGQAYPKVTVNTQEELGQFTTLFGTDIPGCQY